ncbi:MAG: hypothetical protein ABIS45_15905 [Burkholderiales bacterium]
MQELGIYSARAWLGFRQGRAHRTISSIQIRLLDRLLRLPDVRRGFLVADERPHKTGKFLGLQQRSNELKMNIESK